MSFLATRPRILAALLVLVGAAWLAAPTYSEDWDGALAHEKPQRLAVSMSFSVHPFAETFRISRFLRGGSGIEHKVGTFEAKILCNGGFTTPEGLDFRSCYYRLRKLDDLNYDYRIRVVDADGTLIETIECVPDGVRWRCLAL